MHSPSIGLTPARWRTKYRRSPAEGKARSGRVIRSEYTHTHAAERNPRPVVTIAELDDESLGGILDFLRGHFRFVAGVNRPFRFLCYRHAPYTFYMEAMASDATGEILFEAHEVYVRIFGCAFTAKYGNLEALQWFLHSHLGHVDNVCRRAASGGHLHILRWARSQSPPCPWDGFVCAEAASMCVAVAAIANTAMSMARRGLFKCCSKWPP